MSAHKPQSWRKFIEELNQIEPYPQHRFNRCDCPADPRPHCNEMMPDNTFCCGYEEDKIHQLDATKEGE